MGMHTVPFKARHMPEYLVPMQVYLYAVGCVLDITDITDSCEFWSWISSKAKGPSCHTMLQFKYELPIREECFAAYKGNQEAASSEPRRAAKRKGGRRRR